MTFLCVPLAWTELLVHGGTGAVGRSGQLLAKGFPGVVYTCGDSSHGSGRGATSLIIRFSPGTLKKLGSFSNKGGKLLAIGSILLEFSVRYPFFFLLRNTTFLSVSQLLSYSVFWAASTPFFLSWSSLIFCFNGMNYCLVLLHSCHPGSPFSFHSWLISTVSSVLTSTLLGFHTCLLEILQ